MTEDLAGIRILDFTRVLAGPLCTMMLADLGADVIKIERLGSGDETRGWGPPFDAKGRSAYFLSVNRNKRSVSADLESADDRALVSRLIDGADVVVDNYRRGTLERRGLDPDAALAARPSLIWCTISGFGPASDRPGYDVVVQAESGWMAITGEPGGAPMKSGLALADIVAGKDAGIAILAALVARARTGRGRRLHISLAHSATAALVNVAQNALVTGRDATRWGNAHANLVPYELFRAADRSLVIAVGSDAQWRACASALGLDELARDERLATNAGRLDHRQRVVEVLAERLSTDTAARWMERLQPGGVPCGVVKSVLESLAQASASPLTGVAPGAQGTVRRHPPALDEHGAEVRERGWA